MLPVEKKWRLVHEHVESSKRDETDQITPRQVVDMIEKHLDPNVTKMKRIPAKDFAASIPLLTNLEALLRTRSLEWVERFISDECDGGGRILQYMELLHNEK